MTWYERDYYSQQPSSSSLGAKLKGHSMVTWLIVINVAVFILGTILSGASRIPTWAQPIMIGNFNVDQAFVHYQLWRLITYQFLHAGFFHILFNMIVLYFFGPMLEKWLGSKRFLAFYLLCGISGAVVMSALAYVPNLLPGGPAAYLIGASGAIFGILVADAVVFPKQKVMLLIPPIPMTIRTLALCLLGLVIIEILIGSPNAGGEACHLGGALLGFILIKNARWLDWVDRLHLPSFSKSTRHKPAAGYSAPAGTNNRKAPSLNTWKQRTAQHQKEQSKKDEQQVDRILDKVKQQGLQSLTKKEKQTLNRATERLNK